VFLPVASSLAAPDIHDEGRYQVRQARAMSGSLRLRLQVLLRAASDRRSFETVNRRAQDASRGRLHEAAAAGLIDGFIHAYLRASAMNCGY
jgi:hypothetical protein